MNFGIKRREGKWAGIWRRGIIAKVTKEDFRHDDKRKTQDLRKIKGTHRLYESKIIFLKIGERKKKIKGSGGRRERREGGSERKWNKSGRKL